MKTSIKHILCVGGGLLGLPVAKHFASTHQVSLIKRTKADESDNINYLYVDITDLNALKEALPTQVDIVLVCLTPSEISESGYQKIFIDGLGNLANAMKDNKLKPQHLFFVSSTSVYHQNDSQIVDEDTATLPQSFAGKTLLAAEKMLAQSGFPSTVIRFSGIYGGNRTRLLDQARLGQLPAQPSEVFTNRIHESDCIGFLEHLIAKSIQGESLHSLYLASDCAPVSTNTLADWFKQHIRCQPTEESAPSPKRRAGSKRCNNQRMQASGYQLKYPSWKEGYGEMIQRLYPDEAL